MRLVQTVLIGIAPDLLEVSVDVDALLVRDPEFSEPASEALSSTVPVEVVSVAGLTLDLEPPVGEAGNVSVVPRTVVAALVPSRVAPEVGSLVVMDVSD